MSRIINRLADKESITIITHDGRFHLDELISIAFLETLLAPSNITIIRTRVNSVIDTGDLIIDVGGSYDGAKYFDHHQPNDPRVVDRSALSLIWSDIRYEYVKLMFNKYAPDTVYQWMTTDEPSRILGGRIVDSIVNPVSEIDHGNYTTSTANNSLALHRLVVSMNGNDSINNDDRFHRAYRFVKEYMDLTLEHMVADTIGYWDSVYEMNLQSGPICILPHKGSVLSVYSAHTDQYKHFKLFMYPDGGRGWYIHSFPTSRMSNTPVCPLPVEYQGKHDFNLNIGTKSYEVEFTHHKGFVMLVLGSYPEARQVAMWWLHESSPGDIVIPDAVITEGHHKDADVEIETIVQEEKVVNTPLIDVPNACIISKPEPVVQEPTPVMVEEAATISEPAVLPEVKIRRKTTALDPGNVRSKSDIDIKAISNSYKVDDAEVMPLDGPNTVPISLDPWIGETGNVFNNNPFESLVMAPANSSRKVRASAR